MSEKAFILDLLSHGEWMDSATIAEKASHLIAPERALRLKSVYEHQTKQFDLEQRIRKAKRRAILNRLRWMRVSGLVEVNVVDGKRLYRLLTCQIHDE